MHSYTLCSMTSDYNISLFESNENAFLKCLEDKNLLYLEMC